MAEFSDENTAAFNFAIDYLRRINSILYIADEASMNDDLPAWFKALDVLFRELRNEISDEDLLEELDESHSDLWGNYHKYMKSYVNFHQNVKKNSRFKNAFFTPPNDFRGNLHKFELSLRKIIKDKGMQMPKKADTRFSVM